MREGKEKPAITQPIKMQGVSIRGEKCVQLESYIERNLKEVKSVTFCRRYLNNYKV